MASLRQVEELALLFAGGKNTTIGGTVTNTGFKPLGLFDITSFLSSKALRDWAIILVIGSLFETGHGLLSSWWSWLINSFFLTVVFTEDDPSYEWIQLWLSKHPSWKTARNVSITTSNFGLARTRTMRDAQRTSQKKISYLPAVSMTCSLWDKSRWMQVTREIELSRGGSSLTEILTLRILTRDRNVLTEMMQELQMKHQKARYDSIIVYSSRVRGRNAWKRIATRPKRPLDSIILDPGVVDLVVGDARDFLRSKQWYADRGIPFRRGYLLHGTPGAGKTSLIHSIAGELGLDVYIVSLSRSGLDDTRLVELISNLPERCIALMEDIDAAFHHGINRESPEPAKPVESHDSNGERRRKGRRAPASTRISLSGLLNALDGIAAQEGRILFATTNKYDALDPALRRPGRLDLHVEFKHASRYQVEELFKCFYTPPSSELVEEETTNEVELDKNENGNNPVKDLIDLSSPASVVVSKKIDAEPHAHAPIRRAPTFTSISHHTRPPRLSSDDITKLAVQFAASVPERQISMASLQGFLMMYKTRPYEAVARISAWVERELTKE